MIRVSVVIPTAQRPDAVVRAVRSVLAQTMPDLEAIAVIDGSDPVTIAALATIGDTRLRWIVHPERRGARAARDTGVEAASGEWIAFLDDDDLWREDKLAQQLAAAPVGGALMASLYRVRGPLGDLVKPALPYRGDMAVDEWLFDRHSWFGGGEAMLQTSALMAPRSLFRHLRFGDLGQHEDWELGIRAVAQHGLPLVMIREPLVVYHVDAGPSLGRENRWQGSLAWIESMRDVVSPRAFSGFCLTVATQGLDGPRRGRAFATLLAAARRHGRPTARQLSAWALIWAFPHALRRRVVPCSVASRRAAARGPDSGGRPRARTSSPA